MAGLAFAGAGRAVYPLLDFAGDLTMFAILKINAAGTWQTFASNETSANVSNWAWQREGAGTGPTNALTWTKRTPLDEVWTTTLLLSTTVYVATFITRTGGAAQTPSGHLYISSGTSWGARTTEAMNSTIGPSTAVGGGGALILGDLENGSDRLNGEMHLFQAWNAVLTTTQMDAIIAAKTTAVAAGTGTPVRIYDGSDGLTNDLSGNGQHRTSTTGTSAAGAFTSGLWTFGLGAAAADGVPHQAARRAHRGLTMRGRRTRAGA